MKNKTTNETNKALAAYWAGSISASIAKDVREGNYRVLGKKAPRPRRGKAAKKGE